MSHIACAMSGASPTMLRTSRAAPAVAPGVALPQRHRNAFAAARKRSSSSSSSLSSPLPSSSRSPRAASSVAASAVASADASAVDVAKKELGDGAGVELTVTVPPAAVEAAWNAALSKARKGTSVPGFRKGAKIPDRLIIDAVGGPAAAKALAAEHILRSTLPKALAPHAKSAVQGSERVADDIDALAASLEVSRPFSYRVTFETMPPFKWKSAVKGLKIEVAAAGDDATVDAAAAEQFDAAVKEKSKLLLVAAARPEQPTLAAGDVAVVDFDVTRQAGEDEVRIPGAARQASQMDTATAERDLGLAGLVEGMIGMEVGQERSIPLTLSKNWHPSDLAGAQVTARVRLRELLTWQLPESVDDAWAEQAYPGSETIEGLKRRLRDAISSETASATSAKVQEALTSALAAAVDVAVPQSVLRELGEAEYQAELLEMQAKGRFSLEQVSRLATPQLLEKFIESKRDVLCALHRAQRGVDAIFDEEKLALSDDDVAAELATARGQFEAQGQDFDAERLEEQVRESLKAAKVMDWLKENNNVVVGPPEPVKRSFGG